MKAIVKTTKPIMLIEPQTKEIIEENPVVVSWTQFFEARTGSGQIKILASDLPDEASNDEFQEFMKEADGKEDLAVAAFVSVFAEDKEAAAAEAAQKAEDEALEAEIAAEEAKIAADKVTAAEEVAATAAEKAEAEAEEAAVAAKEAEEASKKVPAKKAKG